ncbi:MAG TPA: hypothetical protein PKA31_03570 [Candidatus Moranbacteria bacterium]|nr:hypothetical protein [Candidatus Moranbacteria bacterium]
MHQKTAISAKSLEAATRAYKLEMQKLQGSDLNAKGKENLVFKILARQFADINFADKQSWLIAIHAELAKAKILRKINGNPYAEKALGEKEEETEKEFPLAEKEAETKKAQPENIARPEEQLELFDESALRPLTKKEHLRSAKPVFKMR